MQDEISTSNGTATVRRRLSALTAMRLLATLCAGFLGVVIAGCSATGGDGARRCGATPDARAALDCERERSEARDAYLRETKKTKETNGTWRPPPGGWGRVAD